MIALHGWRRDSRDLDRALAGLDALAIDLPGFGSTPPPPEAWSTARYAEEVALALDEAAAPVVVLGHSFGGRVAVHLAAQRPEAVRALVLTGVPLLKRAAPKGSGPSLGFRVARALHRRGLVSDDRMEALRRKHGSADYRAAEGVMRDVLVKAVNETYESELRSLRCPVEMVWGADDTAAPAWIPAEAAALVPGGANVTVLEGVDHFTPQRAPEALRDAIRRHLP